MRTQTLTPSPYFYSYEENWNLWWMFRSFTLLPKHAYCVNTFRQTYCVYTLRQTYCVYTLRQTYCVYTLRQTTKTFCGAFAGVFVTLTQLLFPTRFNVRLFYYPFSWTVNPMVSDNNGDVQWSQNLFFLSLYLCNRDGVIFWYFKLWLFVLTLFIVCNISLLVIMGYFSVRSAITFVDLSICWILSLKGQLIYFSWTLSAVTRFENYWNPLRNQWKPVKNLKLTK